eukprot:scaffold30825_cov60-Phaeocystis_antarctica.AAC.1
MAACRGDSAHTAIDRALGQQLQRRHRPRRRRPWRRRPWRVRPWRRRHGSSCAARRCHRSRTHGPRPRRHRGAAIKGGVHLFPGYHPLPEGVGHAVDDGHGERTAGGDGGDEAWREAEQRRGPVARREIGVAELAVRVCAAGVESATGREEQRVLRARGGSADVLAAQGEQRHGARLVAAEAGAQLATRAPAARVHAADGVEQQRVARAGDEREQHGCTGVRHGADASRRGVAARVSQAKLAAPPLATRVGMPCRQEEGVARAARDGGGGAAMHLGHGTRCSLVRAMAVAELTLAAAAPRVGVCGAARADGEGVRLARGEGRDAPAVEGVQQGERGL